MRHLLSLKDLTSEEAVNLVDLALEMKRNPEKFSDRAKNKTLVMIFQKPSTRTRVSFEMAMTQLGGHGIFVDWQTTNFEICDIRDETKSIDHCDLILARLLRQKDLETMAKASFVPVINGLTEKFHPSQVIGDLLTIKEHFGKLKGVKVLYVGMKNNMLNSLVLACHKAGVGFSAILPDVHPIADDHEVNEIIRSQNIQRDPDTLAEQMRKADVVYTDTWIDLELFKDESFREEKERRVKTLSPYQITGKLIERTNAIVLHNQPIHRGFEVDDALVDRHGEFIFKQAHNRLHSAKAIIDFYLHSSERR